MIAARRSTTPRLAGAELAYAEYLGANIALVNAALADVPGLSIVVPARSGPVKLRVGASIRHLASAAAGVAITTLILYDVDAAATFKQVTFRTVDPTNGQAFEDGLTLEQRIPDAAANRTFKVQTFTQLTNATALLLGPNGAGPALTPFLEAIAR